MTRKSPIQAKYEQQQAGQSSRRGVRPYKYTIYVVCLEAPAGHPDWQDKEWFREMNPVNLISHNQSCWPGREHVLQTWLADRAKEIAAAVQAQEGGVWIGRLRDATNDPVPDRRISSAEIAGVERHILDGPAGPARRFLEGRNEQKRPPAETSTIAAHLRGVQNALQGKLTDLFARPGQVKADFDHDPALQADPQAEHWEQG